MAFEFDSAAEAYAAVSLLAVGADGRGTMEERRFLFEELGAMDVFAGHDAESLGALLGALTGRMFSDLAREDDGALGPDAINQLCAGVKAVLGKEQCGEALVVAARLACSDGLEKTEREVLGWIAAGLGLGADAAADAIARASA
jgi:tellurite resistance protein